MGKSIGEKALQINLTKPLYGTIAEIGAGQEVSRWFFKVGGAAGTIAKAMSAYDMTFSDDIYGKEECGRYVVESRVRKMLEHEFGLLENRLTSPSDQKKYFFAFADTVAAKSYKYTGECHGWMGVRFQRNATEKPSQIILHVRMRDQSNLQQQEALGILGVNIIYGAYYHADNVSELLGSLADGDIADRVEINLVRLEGPAFSKVDSVTANLHLLGFGLTPALLFPSDKPVSHLAEELYRKQVICHRGQFDPPLLTDMDILVSARNHYCGAKTESECDPYMISEMNCQDQLNNPDQYDAVKNRVAQLRTCGQHVLITNFNHGFELGEHLRCFTNNHINLVYRAEKLIEIFENDQYKTLEPLARVFNDATRVLIYPSASKRVDKKFHRQPENPLFTMSDYQPSQKNALLFQHLVASGDLIEITDFNQQHAAWDNQFFCDKRSKGDRDWQELLPEALRKWG